MKYVVSTYLFGYRGIFLRFYFDSFELLWSGRKNHVGKKVPTWYNDFAFHVGNHVSICRMLMWVRKTDIFNWIKETNWLVSKGICFLLIGKRMSNIYCWEKLTFSKLAKKIFFRKENLKNALASKSKKVQDIFGETLWHYFLQLSFVYKTMSQISFSFFCLGDKRLLSEFLWKWDWFQGHNEHLPKYLG